jgi:hypothetical protein
LRNFRGCFNDKLVNYVFLLLQFNFIKIGKEIAWLGWFELGFVLTVSSGKNFNGLVCFHVFNWIFC